MALGIIPSRDHGHWQYQTFNLNSSASFERGSLVKLDTARNVAEYTSVDSQYLGVATHASRDSLPTGKVVVAVPSDGARATVDVPTGLVSSVLSYGFAYGITRGPSPDGAPCSMLTTLATSVWSRTVTITGDIDNRSGSSRIEVAFTRIGATFGSVSSTSLA